MALAIAFLGAEMHHETQVGMSAAPNTINGSLQAAAKDSHNAATVNRCHETALVEMVARPKRANISAILSGNGLME